jgi:AcrR family transcriptional regulator
MSVKMDKRPYHSPLRQEQAQATRARILDAAVNLFATNGYAATSIAAIAREAGVVPETIYATYGSKRALIDGLIERAQPEETQAAIQATWAAKAGSPSDQLRDLARGARSFWERNEPLAAVMRQGTGDTEIGGMWHERSEGRRQLFAGLIGQWPRSVFASGLDRETATDVGWAYTAEEMYHLLVVDRGWSPDAYEAWLAGTLVRSLLADG